MIKIKYRHEYTLLDNKKIYWATYCLISEDGVDLIDGVTFLSPKDQFCRYDGRAASFYNAFKVITDKGLRMRLANIVGGKFLARGRKLITHV